MYRHVVSVSVCREPVEAIAEPWILPELWVLRIQYRTSQRAARVLTPDHHPQHTHLIENRYTLTSFLQVYVCISFLIHYIQPIYVFIFN